MPEVPVLRRTRKSFALAALAALAVLAFAVLIGSAFDDVAKPETLEAMDCRALADEMMDGEDERRAVIDVYARKKCI